MYGSGNIYGYKLVRGETSVDNTYEIIPEEAENVRLVYCLYLSGLGIQAISKKMVEMEKKGIDGKTVWSNGKIWNILRNKTYAGFRCYGKSITNNYLTHRRIKNKDRHTYIYQKADFPAIVSEEDWEEVQKIMDSRSDIRNGKRVGIKTETDIWKKKLVCSCGKTFKKYHWRTNKNQVAMYGYACRNVVENRSKEARREMEVELNGMCNVKSFPEWRLEFIFLKIMERMMKNPERMVNKLVAVVEKNYIPDRNTRIHKETAVIKKDMEQAEKRLENLLSGYLDGCIDIADYKEKKEELEKSYKEMKEEYEFLVPTEESREKSLDEKRESLKQVKEKLWELLDREQTQVDKKLVDKIVKKITPCPDSVFKWYLNFKGSETESETDILADSFAIGFEEAEAYRKKCGSFLRKSQWNDILVEVYIGV